MSKTFPAAFQDVVNYPVCRDGPLAASGRGMQAVHNNGDFVADPSKPVAIPPVNMAKPSLARDLLITATQAYKLYPGNCSGAVNWVIVNMADPQMPPLLANDLMTYFANPANGWRQVTSIQEASNLANQGIVVVGGLVERGGHGHVIIVLPGPWKAAGGYKNASGQMMPSIGLFPPAMSTAWSEPGTAPWPGAISNGEKTIYGSSDNPALFVYTLDINDPNVVQYKNGKPFDIINDAGPPDEFPLPVLIGAHREVIGVLPIQIYTSIPQSAHISFLDWRGQLPFKIGFRVVDPTESAPFSPYCPPPLVWHPSSHKYIEASGDFYGRCPKS